MVAISGQKNVILMILNMLDFVALGLKKGIISWFQYLIQKYILCIHVNIGDKEMKLTFSSKTFRTITRYDVSNKRGDILGFINYHAKWKCWVWEQEPDIIMSSDCLKQVVEFMESIK